MKYQELLTVKRELVLPLHMKHLMDVSKFIDGTMTYYKQCRKREERSHVYFKDVVTSIE